MTDLSLKKLSGYTPFAGPVVTVIMDGIGIGPLDESDGVAMAYTPVLDELYAGKLMTQLTAHGKAVGLPTDGDMGNSEGGPNALCAGRIFSQGAKLVNYALPTGAVFQGGAWKEIQTRMEKGGTLHFIVLVSDGNVHSHVGHLYRMLEQCDVDNITKVRVHGLIDGRDVSPKSALEYFRPLEEKLAALSTNGKDYCIASGGGRMIVTMDRYQADWAIVEKGWQAHVSGVGRGFPSAYEAIQTYYDEDPELTDPYMGSFFV